MAYEGRGDRPTEGDPVGSGAGERGGLEEDLKLQRSEEELRAGVREREAGAMNVKKSVRTEREQVDVPRRREEVDVERVPVNQAAPGVEIGEDDEDIVVQVFEEELVVTKRVVLKEEIRIRKTVVEEVEVVEADLRKEEVEIDDQTSYGGRGDRRQRPISPERG